MPPSTFRGGYICDIYSNRGKEVITIMEKKNEQRSIRNNKEND